MNLALQLVHVAGWALSAACQTGLEHAKVGKGDVIIMWTVGRRLKRGVADVVKHWTKARN